MAQVTVELRNLLTLTDFELFDFEYQFDDPLFKKEIEQQITDFFYDYEIGSETPDMFKRKFKARFLRIIGYYNQLYNTTLLQYNPLINSKMSEALEQLATTAQSSTAGNTSTSGNTRTDDLTATQTTATSSAADGTRTDNLTAAQTGSNTTVGNQKASDYPQQPIAGGQYLAGEEDSTSTSDFDTTTTNTGTVTDSSTASSDSDSTARNTGTVTDSGTSTSDTNTSLNGTTDTTYSKTIEGLTGTTYQDLIRQERENLLRIPQMIISELKPCFILIY